MKCPGSGQIISLSHVEAERKQADCRRCGMTLEVTPTIAPGALGAYRWYLAIVPEHEPEPDEDNIFWERRGSA